MKFPTPGLSPCSSFFFHSLLTNINQLLLRISPHAFTCCSGPFISGPGNCLPLRPHFHLLFTLLSSTQATPITFQIFHRSESFHSLLSQSGICLNYTINHFCPLRLHTGITTSRKYQYYLIGLDAFPEQHK